MMTLEDRGVFWWNNEQVPDGQFAPISAVPGNLTIDDEGRITLELDGFLPSSKAPFAALLGGDDSTIRDRQIQGFLKATGSRVLLLGVIPVGGQLSSYKMSYERFAASTCLVGDGALSSPTPLRFYNIEIDLKGFEDWLRLASIEIRRTKTLLSTRYKYPKDIIYVLNEGKLSLRYKLHGPLLLSGAHKDRSLLMNESATLVYTPTRPASLDTMLYMYGMLQELFILLTDSEYLLEWPRLSLGRKRFKYTIYFLRLRNSSSPPSVDTWTNFLQIERDFGDMFSAWITKRETFGSGFYLYLGTRRGMRLYPEHRFVNLIWGIEALHRRKYPDLSGSSKYIKKVQNIVDQITAIKDKKWLQQKLKYAGEPNLEQRIFGIFKNMPIGLDTVKLRRFCKDCADTRNEISHFGGERQSQSNSETLMKLQQKSEALSYLYHALLLYEIGVAERILNWWIYEGFRSYTIKEAFFKVGLIDEDTLKATSRGGAL
jgi:hypothetical protein